MESENENLSDSTYFEIHLSFLSQDIENVQKHAKLFLRERRADRATEQGKVHLIVIDGTIQSRLFLPGSIPYHSLPPTVLADESCFVVGARGCARRRKADTDPEVCWIKSKFPLNVTVFNSIANNDKSALILAESGTINAESYLDDFLDHAGIIPDLNQCHGCISGQTCNT
jgi:hypothetical protein